jgi:hypothetical protein
VDENVNLRYVIFLAATAALGGLLFGFDIAIITGAGPFLLEHFKLTELSLGWAFSCLLFGCVVGSAFAGRLADRYGRKRVLLAVSVMFAATSAATGLASTFANFVAARFLGGLAVGEETAARATNAAIAEPKALGSDVHIPRKDCPERGPRGDKAIAVNLVSKAIGTIPLVERENRRRTGPFRSRGEIHAPDVELVGADLGPRQGTTCPRGQVHEPLSWCSVTPVERT